MAITYKDMVLAANAVVPAITARDAAKLVETAGAVLVDVRDGTELQATGKAKGALAIPRGSLESRADPESPNYNQALRKDRPVILYCAGGGRAALAGKTLCEMGYTEVRNLGGFRDWVAGGGDIERV
jgi:rhodanese-related sulfurtransferase